MARPAEHVPGVRTRTWSPSKTVFLVLLTIPFVYPFLFMISTALKTETDYIEHQVGPPRAFTLDHLSYAWNGAHLGQALINSTIAVATGVAVCTIFSSMSAFWFYRHRGTTASGLRLALIGLWIFPFVVYVLPFFVILSDHGLVNNLLVLGLVYATLNAPFGLYLMYLSLEQGIPDDVMEAAQVDGASLWQQYWRIVVPLSRPMLARWSRCCSSSCGGPADLGDPHPGPRQVHRRARSGDLGRQFDAGVQNSAAAAIIAIVPVLIVFLIAQRAIVRSFTQGVGRV